MYNYTVGQQAYYIPGYPNPVYPLQVIPQGVAVNGQCRSLSQGLAICSMR